MRPFGGLFDVPAGLWPVPHDDLNHHHNNNDHYNHGTALRRESPVLQRHVRHRNGLRIFPAPRCLQLRSLCHVPTKR